MSHLIRLALLVAFAAPAFAQSPENFSGHWQVTGDIFGTTFFQSLDLTQQGSKLTGKFGGDKLEGTIDGGKLHFVSKDEDNNTDEVTATLAKGTLAGTILETAAQNPGHPTHMSFTAAIAAKKSVRTITFGLRTASWCHNRYNYGRCPWRWNWRRARQLPEPEIKV